MRKVKTVSICLEPEFARILEELGEKAGSKSRAVRDLLLEHAYREYYSDARNVKEGLELTMAMRSIAAFPEEWHAKPPRHPRKRTPAR